MKKSVIKFLGIVLAAMLCLCSCQHAQKIADAVVSSAGAELSSALSEGKSEIADGIKEIGEAAGEVTSAISSIYDDIGSVGGEVSGKIDEALSEAAEDIVSEMTETSSEETTVLPETSELLQETEAETTAAPAKQYTFRNKQRYDDHYKKHGAEFGDITQEEYLQLANDLINSTSDRVLHKMSKDGDYLFFDQDTGYFLVLADDDYIRTFFIPSAGKKYYDKQ